jgi:hypothetical protein
MLQIRVARFFGETYQNGEKYTKWPQHIPKDHIIYEMAIKYIFHFKTLQNLPQLGFLV